LGNTTIKCAQGKLKPFDEHSFGTVTDQLSHSGKFSVLRLAPLIAAAKTL
jgi:hypothetical protein